MKTDIPRTTMSYVLHTLHDNTEASFLKLQNISDKAKKESINDFVQIDTSPRTLYLFNTTSSDGDKPQNIIENLTKALKDTEDTVKANCPEGLAFLKETIELLQNNSRFQDKSEWCAIACLTKNEKIDLLMKPAEQTYNYFPKFG